MADLDPLLRLGRWQVDEQRRHLGILLAREEQLLAQQAVLAQELVAEQAAAGKDALGAGLTYADYGAAVIARREALERATIAVRAEIDKAREELAEAYRQLKTYETVHATRQRRAAEEAARREQAVLDDIGQTLHRRRQAAEE